MSENTIANPWNALCDIIDGLNSEYEKLQVIMHTKQRLLIENKNSEFQELNKEEQAFINEIEKMENKRLEISKACMPDSDGPPTLQQLLETAPEDVRESLELNAVKLMEQLNGIASANRGVYELINEAMNFVNFQLNLLGTEQEKVTIYEGSGKMRDQKPKMKGIFNQKA